MQYLTENQRAVRERQRAETATMFPGLRSSISLIDPGSPLRSRSIQIDDRDMTDSAPLTPIIPPAFIPNDDEFPGSSPTPGSKVQVRPMENILVSSPLPSIQELPQLDPSSSPPQAEVFQSSNDRIMLKAAPQW